jgi:hypothetical protein
MTARTPTAMQCGTSHQAFWAIPPVLVVDVRFWLRFLFIHGGHPECDHEHSKNEYKHGYQPRRGHENGERQPERKHPHHDGHVHEPSYDTSASDAVNKQMRRPSAPRLATSVEMQRVQYRRGGM